MTSSLIDVLKDVFKKSTLGGGYGVITGSAALHFKRSMPPETPASSCLWCFPLLDLAIESYVPLALVVLIGQ